MAGARTGCAILYFYFNPRDALPHFQVDCVLLGPEDCFHSPGKRLVLRWVVIIRFSTVIRARA
jgi:hypothetical protein